MTRPAPSTGRAARRPTLMLGLVLAGVLVVACSHDPAARVLSTGGETTFGFTDLPVGVAGWVGWRVILESGEAEVVEARFIDVEPGLDVPEVRAVRASESGRIGSARDDQRALSPPDRGPAGMPVGADQDPDWYLLIRVVATGPGRHQARNLEITLDVDGHPVRHVERLVIEVDAV